MDKNQLRKEIKERIKTLDDTYCRKASSLIEEKLKDLEAYQSASTVFTFVGAHGEPDTKGFMEDALAKGKRVCVPLCIGDGIMVAKEVKGFDDLEKGSFGLKEPKSSLPTVEPAEIDFGVIPCVTCDYAGNRLGHGKGFYDRYLEAGKFPKAMVCFEKLISEDIPMDPHDKKMDFVITERADNVK